MKASRLNPRDFTPTFNYDYLQDSHTHKRILSPLSLPFLKTNPCAFSFFFFLSLSFFFFSFSLSPYLSSTPLSLRIFFPIVFTISFSVVPLSRYLVVCVSPSLASLFMFSFYFDLSFFPLTLFVCLCFPFYLSFPFPLPKFFPLSCLTVQVLPLPSVYYLSPFSLFKLSLFHLCFSFLSVHLRSLYLSVFFSPSLHHSMT